ncbi:YdcF family protein [Jezberella montanilacus]|nr:YdcF family protein [Jezberella montanilacus]
MIYAHKILPLFFSPLFVVFMLLALSIWLKRRVLVAIASLTLYLTSIPITAFTLINSIEQYQLKLTVDDSPQADAIVVLGGMIDWVKTTHGVAPEWGDPDRFWDGIALIKAGRAPMLIFTGGKLPWQLGDETEGQVLKRYAIQAQVPEEKILVSDPVETTHDEAKAIAKMLDPIKSRIILVTSAFHMPRAKALFDDLGFDVFAYPVDFRASGRLDLYTAFLPNPSALATTDFCIRELLGRMYYRVNTILR